MNAISSMWREWSQSHRGKHVANIPHRNQISHEFEELIAYSAGTYSFDPDGVPRSPAATPELKS